MFHIHFLGIRPIFNELHPIFSNFAGSLETSCEGDFTSVLIVVLEVKMGQGTQNIFFAENENITPGLLQERFWK